MTTHRTNRRARQDHVDAEQWRQRAAAHFGTRRRTRYPLGLRHDAASYVQQRIDEGADVAAAADELGVHRDTLQRWSDAATPVNGSDKKTSASLVPVVVRAEARSVSSLSGGIVLHGPAGVRVEGLTVTQLAELMGSLAC